MRLAGCLLACAAASAAAAPGCSAGTLSAASPWLAGVQRDLADIAEHGQPALLLTGYTWHDPGTYTAAKRATLNSRAWGLGYARHLLDARGNDQMLYAMVFSDSHRNAQPVVGYARQWDWRPAAGPLVLGAGYTAAVTSRADILHNIPFPIVLPVASVGVGRLRLYGTFLPRVSNHLNNGNVAFFFASVAFD